ncbi:MAG: membrane protein insertion efficiency factor YidD [Candidatus Phosphoribacter sp.]
MTTVATENAVAHADAVGEPSTITVLLGPLRGPWTWRTVWVAPLLLLVRAYQLLFSPMELQTCRFYPSCSGYAVTALLRFGPLRGGWLAARRLGRCHPWNPGGVDHVPESGHRHSIDGRTTT